MNVLYPNDRLLDASVPYAIGTLKAHGYTVPGTLRTSFRSIYYGALTPIHADALYDAGFQGVAACDLLDRTEGKELSPLVYQACHGNMVLA